MKASDNVFPKVLFAEGAAAATPSTGDVVIYAKSDGLMYSKDDAGVETPLGGGGSSRAIVTVATSTSGVLGIDWATGDYFTHTFDENITSWNFTNLPSSPTGIALVIRFQQDPTTPRTMTWPASFRWVGGTDGVISNTTNAVDVLSLISFDQGTTWIAHLNNGYAA